MQGNRLIDLLPYDVYHEEEHVVALQSAIEEELRALQEARDSLLAQCRPSTATWGMTRYEREWDLPVDESKPLDQRLSSYRAKRRGQGTITVETIRAIAKSFYNGEVDVVPQEAPFRYEIVFLSQVGAPPQMAELQAAIEDIKPAHVVFTYKVLWVTHGDLARLTHAQLANYTHQHIHDTRIEGTSHESLLNKAHQTLVPYTHEEIQGLGRSHATLSAETHEELAAQNHQEMRDLTFDG